MIHYKPLIVGLLGTAALLAAVPSRGDTAKPDVSAQAQAPVPSLATDKGTPPSAGPSLRDRADRSKDDQATQTRRDDRKAFMEARLAALHAGLQLTPQQDPLWSPVEAALRGLVTARRDMRPRNDEMPDASARLKQRGTRMIALGQAIGKLADATGPLLGALSPAQKERLPVLLRGVGPRRLVTQAFAVEDDRDDMRGGEQGRGRPPFADRDDRDRVDFDRPKMDRDGGGGSGGWRHRRRDWDGRADSEGMGRGRFERDGDVYRRPGSRDEDGEDRG